MVLGKQNDTSNGEYQDPIVSKTGKPYNGETEKKYEFSKVSPPSLPDVKVFKRRWLQLALFAVYSTINNMQWFQYAVCSNIMQRYWGVSSFAIDSTTMIHMVVYLVIVFPATHLMDRVGLRWTCLIGAGGTCLGAWIKVFSASPDRFVVTFIGQTMVALSQIFVISSPGRLAAYWFGPEQVALATTIGCYGMQAGFSIAFIFTTLSIKNHEDIGEIGDDLHKYFITLAIICTVVLILLLLFFQDEPSLSPSMTRAIQKTNRETGTTEGFWPPLKRILSNKSFLLLWNCYGSVACLLGTMGTVMNPLYLAHFENGGVDVGNIGFVYTAAGTIGATFFSFLLDKTKKFRLIFTTVCICTLVFQVLFAVSMVMEVKWMAFVSVAFWGVFIIGYASMGIELCAETTYPEAEGAALGILNISNQVYGTALIVITGRMIELYGDIAGHACMIASVAFGTILLIFSKLELRRSKAAKAAGYNNVKLQVLKPEKNEPTKDSWSG